MNSGPDAAERPTPEVSVVVTVRNEGSRIRTLLGAIGRQTLDRDRFELVVVDDASDDDTRDIVRAHGLGRLVEQPRHGGLPAGRNAGIRASLAPIVAFTDGDCIPADDWLERGLKRLASDDAEILAGGIRIPVDGSPSIAALVDAATYLDQEGYIKVGFGAGANLWMRRTLFEQHGVFNERVGMYGDEAELCQRAGRGGARLLYAPEVVVVHPARSRVRDLTRKSFRQGYCSAAHRRYGSGLLRDRPPSFRSLRAYTPRRRVRGVDRLRADGLDPSGRQIVGMYLYQYAFVQLTRVAGDISGEVRHRVAGRRGSPPVPPA
ncbi:MAG: glycosyltransferase family 2 protein [Thermoleophilia bacterium]